MIRRLLPIAALLLAAHSALADPVPDAMLDGLAWRQIGPFRAGWGTAVAGIPDQPDTFLFGGAGGGVFKTTDAGVTWNLVSDQAPAMSIGALAIAPSDSKRLYAGTGQVTTRYDIAAGDGVWTSEDGGAHWKKIGLDATRHIGAISVDPRNANTLLVAALGHAFGPNKERGVYKSTDAGKTWTQTLFVDENVGASELARDPRDPNLVYASTWQVRFRPWLSYFTPDIGPGSAIWKSTDGGAHFTKLGGEGWPAGPLGRIGLAAARTSKGAPRLYALVDAPKDGGLYRSDDGGAHWTLANPDGELVNGYFSKLAVLPSDADVVFTMGRSIRRCDQAGAHCVIFKGAPGGDDYHEFWINPRDPSRMITGSDQGTVVTVNGGASWSSWYNQPTGQFYHVATDNRFPYWVYAGQQDSGTARVSSRSDYGAITFRDWHPTGADERDDEIPDPSDPNIVYGSGLGGRLTRWDARDGQTQNITPWPISSYGARPTQYSFRYTWITPIAVSAQPPHALYFGSQTLYRSTDQGAHWDPVSRDLSAKSTEGKTCEGDLDASQARACGYGVIYDIAPSPRAKDEIWVGTDDGLVQLTRDGGKTWSNVTPPAVPAWAKIARVDPSAAVEGVAYIAVDNHRQDDFRPHVFKTRDFGKTWSEIVTGLPADHFVDVVRGDPERDGLLYAGTEAGVFVSLDDGAHWQSLTRNLPGVWVRDLVVKDRDLVIATQGRALWILDDVARLRQIAASPSGAAAALFAPSPAYRLRLSQGKDTPLPPEEPQGQNPPTGALIDYWLPADVARVELEVRDSSGKVVRRFASDDKPERLPVEPYFHSRWQVAPPMLSAKAGAHRFVWNLRGVRPKSAHFEYTIAATAGRDTPALPEGVLVAPGDYTLVMKAGDRELKSKLVVKGDPRVRVDTQAIAAAHALYAEVAAELARGYVAIGELAALKKQADALAKQKKEPALDALVAAAAPLSAAEGEQGLNFGAITETLAGIATDLEGSDRLPTQAQRDVLAVLRKRHAATFAAWDAVKAKELVAANAALVTAGLKPIVLPKPEEIDLAAGVESKDLP